MLQKFSIFFMLFALTSCQDVGPLYYHKNTVQNEIAAIEIEEIDNVLGSDVYYHLEKLLGHRSDSKYLLKVKQISDNSSELVITDRSDLVKQNVSLEYKYFLYSKDNGSELTRGKIRMVGSYDTTTSSYHSYVSEAYLKKDLAETLASEIHLRLMLYFGDK